MQGPWIPRVLLKGSSCPSWVSWLISFGSWQSERKGADLISNQENTVFHLAVQICDCHSTNAFLPWDGRLPAGGDVKLGLEGWDEL